MKKALIVSYYWPPAGGPGVQRWLKFAAYLPEYQVTPVLYIPEDAHYPIIDTSLLKEVPKDIRIYRTPIREPYKWANFLSKKKTKRISSGIISTGNPSFLEKLFLWIRGNLFIPDARKYWVKPSVAFLTDILKKEEIDTIISTGPPHSMHLIGLGVKQQLGIRWIADFRDPWTSIGYHKELRLTKKAARRHKELERKVLTSADAILVTSQTTKKEFEGITTKPITVITNGFDTTYCGGAILDEHFSIAHIGSLLTDRNPELLWEVLSELTKEDVGFKEDLQINLIGVISQAVLASIETYGLNAHVMVTDYLPHEEAMKAQRRSQVLLLAEIDSTETSGIIPGKLFEYMAARRPILAIGPKGWEVAGIIRQTKSGAVFHPEEKQALKSTIFKWYTLFRKGNLMAESDEIMQYSRQELTKKVAAQVYGDRI